MKFNKFDFIFLATIMLWSLSLAIFVSPKGEYFPFIVGVSGGLVAIIARVLGRAEAIAETTEVLEEALELIKEYRTAIEEVKDADVAE